MEVDADQIANRVVVFVAIEPADGHPAGIAILSTIGFGQRGIDPSGNSVALGGRELGLLFGRHFPGVQLFGNFFPDFAILDERRPLPIGLERQLALGLGGTVAFLTILNQKRLDLLAKLSRGRPLFAIGRGFGAKCRQRRQATCQAQRDEGER